MRRVILFTGFHLGSLGLLWTGLSWEGLFLGVLLIILRSIGISVGYHRYFSHKSFTAKRSVEIVLVVLGSMAAQGSLFEWVSTHRVHHKFTDAEGDPHSPRRGFFWAHLGPLITSKLHKTYVKDLVKDPVLVWCDRHYRFWVFVAISVCFLLLRWEGLTVFVLSTIFLYHLTFCINSLCHMIGRRPFETNDTSTNFWPIGILGSGEGWHNNHHRFPSSWRLGLKWWQIDLGAYVIWVLGKMRLVVGLDRVTTT